MNKCEAQAALVALSYWTADVKRVEDEDREIALHNPAGC
jgi:hypothetical protein